MSASGPSETSRPETLDLQPTLVGSRVTLRPLRASDFDALHGAASDPVIWEQHPDRRRYMKDRFRSSFFESGLESRGALVVSENDSGSIIGSSRYYDLNRDVREVAIGYTFLEVRYWGTGVNREMKALMLDHAFRWADRVWFHVGTANLRSCRALEKIGATFSHVGPRDIGGKTLDHAYYSISRSTYRRPS